VKKYGADFSGDFFSVFSFLWKQISFLSMIARDCPGFFSAFFFS